MRLIGAGFPRTGTFSTQAALIRLGLPCYHMFEVVCREEHTNAWYDFLARGRPMDWTTLFAEYDATVDAPAAFFWREILAAFPDAKVLLNVRDPQTWFESFMTLTAVMAEFAPHRESNPRLERWLSMVEAMRDRTFGEARERDALVAAFEEHNRRVREEVPPSRLLVFRVQDGWAPLCRFLGCEAPPEPFPHLNEGPDTVRAGLRAAFGIA